MSRISDVVKQDHRELQDMHQQILNASDDSVADTWANKFNWALARYEAAEELVVYPALEGYMDGGKVIADKDRAENKDLKKLLTQFQSMKPEDQRFHPMLETIMEKLNDHINEEEDEDLPSLESVTDDMESETLAKQFERTKILTPTGAQANNLTQPLFDSVASLTDAPADRISNIMGSFSEE